MKGASARSDERFRTVLDEFGSALWRLTAGYAEDRDDRNDLHQDILVSIWRALPRFEGRSSIKTFVYRIAHNRGVTHRSKAKRRPADPVRLSHPDPSPGPEEQMESRRRRDVLNRAVRELPVSLRQPVMLRLDGLRNTEIADVLGISEGNVAVRLNRARAKLARTLKPEAL